MVMQTCGKCYRVKELTPVHPSIPDMLACTRCRYDVEETLGFLEYNGVEVTLALPQPNSPETKKTG